MLDTCWCRQKCANIIEGLHIKHGVPMVAPKTLMSPTKTGEKPGENPSTKTVDLTKGTEDEPLPVESSSEEADTSDDDPAQPKKRKCSNDDTDAAPSTKKRKLNCTLPNFLTIKRSPTHGLVQKHPHRLKDLSH